MVYIVANMTIARQRFRKHVPAATNRLVKIKASPRRLIFGHQLVTEHISMDTKTKVLNT
jgi:hypothetical protein